MPHYFWDGKSFFLKHRFRQSFPHIFKHFLVIVHITRSEEAFIKVIPARFIRTSAWDWLKRGGYIRTHPLLWIFAIVLLVKPVHGQNLGFEDGLNGWVTSYNGGGQDYTPIATAAWSTEGSNSLLFGGASGFKSLGSVKSAINHSSFVANVGDSVCLDFKKNGTVGNSWTLRSSILGSIKSPVLDGVFTNSCFPAMYQGKLDFIAEGNPQGCTGTCISTKIFLDNIRMYACNDGVKNGFEKDVDCGGFCSRCDNGNFCNSNNDCSSFYCSNNE